MGCSVPLTVMPDIGCRARWSGMYSLLARRCGNSSLERCPARGPALVTSTRARERPLSSASSYDLFFLEPSRPRFAGPAQAFRRPHAATWDATRRLEVFSRRREAVLKIKTVSCLPTAHFEDVNTSRAWNLLHQSAFRRLGYRRARLIAYAVGDSRLQLRRARCGTDSGENLSEFF